eukprot:252600-Pleurochrysis_carterae.AAC.2
MHTSSQYFPDTRGAVRLLRSGAQRKGGTRVHGVGAAMSRLGNHIAFMPSADMTEPLKLYHIFNPPRVKGSLNARLQVDPGSSHGSSSGSLTSRKSSPRDAAPAPGQCMPEGQAQSGPYAVAASGVNGLPQATTSNAPCAQGDQLACSAFAIGKPSVPSIDDSIYRFKRIKPRKGSFAKIGNKHVCCTPRGSGAPARMLAQAPLPPGDFSAHFAREACKIHALGAAGSELPDMATGRG